MDTSDGKLRWVSVAHFRTDTNGHVTMLRPDAPYNDGLKSAVHGITNINFTMLRPFIIRPDAPFIMRPDAPFIIRPDAPFIMRPDALFIMRPDTPFTIELFSVSCLKGTP